MVARLGERTVWKGNLLSAYRGGHKVLDLRHMGCTLPDNQLIKGIQEGGREELRFVKNISILYFEVLPTLKGVSYHFCCPFDQIVRLDWCPIAPLVLVKG